MCKQCMTLAWRRPLCWIACSCWGLCDWSCWGCQGKSRTAADFIIGYGAAAYYLLRGSKPIRNARQLLAEQWRISATICATQASRRGGTALAGGVCLTHKALAMACVGLREKGEGRGGCRSHPGFAPDASRFPALSLGLLVLPAQALQGADSGEPSVHGLYVVHSISLRLCLGAHAIQGGCSHPAAHHSSSLSSCCQQQDNLSCWPAVLQYMDGLLLSHACKKYAAC